MVIDGSNSALPNAEFIERCQLEYDRNPGSRVFAPLSEAYRKLGLINEAFELASRGVRLHPDFAAGRIAFARLLIEKKNLDEAIDQLARAAELSPDNILAFQLLGETYLEVRRPKEALAAFKMVLFLNPLHERAQKMVRKWEFLTADEFESEQFEWTENASERPSADSVEQPNNADRVAKLEDDGASVAASRADREAHRAISIADALTVRNDLDGAFAVLGRSIRYLGARPDLEQRLHLLGRRLGLAPDDIQKLAEAEQQASRENDKRSPLNTEREQKKRKLNALLKKLHLRPGD